MAWSTPKTWATGKTFDAMFDVLDAIWDTWNWFPSLERMANFMLFMARTLDTNIRRDAPRRSTIVTLRFEISDADSLGNSFAEEQKVVFDDNEHGLCYVYVARKEKAEEIDEFRAIVRLAELKGHMRAIEAACKDRPELQEHFDAILGEFKS